MHRHRKVVVPRRDIFDIQNERANVIGDQHKGAYNMVEEMDKKSNYERTILKGNHCDNVLNQLFFSQRNLNIIQNGLRHKVWEQSERKHVISRQSETELIIIMRAIFLQHAKNADTNIREQLEELNQVQSLT